MYKCFENIPLTQRKQAYSAIVVNKAPHIRGGWAQIDGLTYCPLGVVNKVLLDQNPKSEKLHSFLREMYSESTLRMPPNGTVAADILGFLGVQVDREDAWAFIYEVDSGKIATQNDLAVALGIG